jgi:hypothetical protein
MHKQQYERSQRIYAIMELIKQKMSENPEYLPQREDFRLFIMDRFVVSRRVADEYLDIAFLRLNLK